MKANVVLTLCASTAIALGVSASRNGRSSQEYANPATGNHAQERVPPRSKDGSIDQAGVTSEQRLHYLLNSHDAMLDVCTGDSHTEEQKQNAEVMFLQRCIAAILHAQGRAEFMTAEDIQRGGFLFKAGDVTENEFVFFADGARYRYQRGEFPIVDLANDISRRRADRYRTAFERKPADFDGQIESLFDQALRSLETDR